MGLHLTISNVLTFVIEIMMLWCLMLLLVIFMKSLCRLSLLMYLIDGLELVFDYRPFCLFAGKLVQPGGKLI